MANNIKGITIEIGADTQPLDKALKNVNKTSRDLQSELREVEKLLKLDPTNTTLLAQKQKLLADSVSNTSTKLETLKEAERQAQQQFKQGKIAEEQYRALQREIIKTEQSLEGLEKQAKQAIAVLSKDQAVNNLKNIGKAAGAAAVAAGAAVVGLGAAAVNTADELQRQSDVTGLSAERLQELQYAGGNLGVELETLTGAQAKLTKSMTAASEGETKYFESVDKTTKEINELVKSGASYEDILKRLQKEKSLENWSAEELKKFAKELKNGKISYDDLWTVIGEGTEVVNKNDAAFSKLGVKVKDQNGNLRDSKIVMMEVIDSLGKIENETERDSLAMQIFGKSAMELNPIIKAGGDELNRLSGEARSHGAVMSNEAVAGLDAFGDTIDNLKTSILGSFGEKFAQILPQAQGLIDKLTELPQWIQQNSTLLIILGVVIGTITALLIAYNFQQYLAAEGLTLWSFLAGIGTTVTTALGTAFTFLTSPIGLVILAIGALIAIGVLLWKNWDTVKAKAIEIFGSIGKFTSGVIDGIKNGFKGMVNGVIGGLNFMVRGINKLKFDVPDWVPNIGGKKFGFNIPEIPSFAVGTRYLPEDMLIQAHEGEMIIPKSQNPYANSGGTIVPNKSVTLNFNGNYSFRDKDDIDYFIQQAGETLVNDTRGVGLEW